ncbi:MAG: hypothetical protein IRZ28_04835 [Steroidobacteraceae bacterium]|nr:hypothetical protein [Steroidobacteraceae bacterium]
MDSDSSDPSLASRLEILRRRWQYPAIITPACILLAIFVAYVMTPLYRSSGTIMLEPSSVPKEFLGLDTTTYADHQFELVQRRVMTPENLRQLVAKIDPYPDRPDLTPTEKARMIADNTEIERVDPITLETLQQSNAFSIHYLNPNPERAKAVANELVALFLDYNARTRRERAAGTYHFLQSEAQKLAESIRGMEAKLAEFKAKYGDALPQAQARNLQAQDMAQRDYDSTMAQVRLAEQRVSMLQLQLNDLSPTLVGAVADRRTELATLRAELAAAEQRYTQDHPDVRRLRRAIAELAAQDQATRAPAAKPDNPEYLRVSAELDAAKRDLNALRAHANRALQQVQDYSRRLASTPTVEKEYAQLARNYELAQESFREVQAKLTEADLARSLVAEEQGERFTLIRDPGTPSSPAVPNRLGIILLGFVLGTALGFGAAMFAELSDPTVRGASDLQLLTGHTMIAAVPALLNSSERRSRRLRFACVVGAFSAAIIAVGAAVLSASS